MLHAFDATPEDVRLAAIGVLGDSTYRQSAKRLEAEIAALPDHEHAVRLLEQLAARAG